MISDSRESLQMHTFNIDLFLSLMARVMLLNSRIMTVLSESTQPKPPSKEVKFQGNLNLPTHFISNSCVERCGRYILFVTGSCACDLRCAVYKNCCEDMTTVCGHVYNKSLLIYRHMLSSEVECRKDRIFYITSCPLSLSDTTRYEDTTQHLKTNTNFTTEVSDIFGLLGALHKAPVTDETTGFVYTDMDVYECNAIESSNPLMWNVRIKSNLTTVVDKDNLLVSNLEYGSEVFYVSPSNAEDELSGERCVPESIDTCAHDFNEDNNTLRDLCQAFTSYVMYANNTAHAYYKNHYCALCNGIEPGLIQPLYEHDVERCDTRHNLEFPFLTSLTGNILKIENLQETTDLPWKLVTCDVSISNSINEVKDGLICKMIKCSNNFSLRPDGRCKIPYEFHIGISDDGYPMTDEHVKGLPEFIVCYLKQRTDLDVDAEWQPLTHVRFDHRLKILLYISRIIMYTESQSQRSETSRILPHLKLMAFFFHVHRKMRMVNSENSVNRTVCGQWRCHVQDIETQDVLSLYPDVDNVMGTADTRGGNTTTHVCICRITLVEPPLDDWGAERACTLYCAQAHLSTHDAHLLDTTSVNVSCLDAFVTHSSANNVFSYVAHMTLSVSGIIAQVYFLHQLSER